MAKLVDRSRGPGHCRGSPGAEKSPACCLVLGTVLGRALAFRAKNDWKPGWKTVRQGSGQQCGDLR